MWPFPIDDFSSINLWPSIAFVAGLICFAVVRSLAGIDRCRIAEIQNLRSEASTLAADNSRLTIELAEASRIAAIAHQLDDEVIRLRRVEEAGKAAIDAAVRQVGAKHQQSIAQLAGLRDELETSAETAQYYQDEYDRLAQKHDELAKTAYDQSSHVAELETKLDAAAQHADDAARLRSEIDRARSEIAGLRAELEERSNAVVLNDGAAREPALDGIDPELYESEVSVLLSTVHDLRDELSASEGALNKIRDALGESHRLAS